LTVEINTKRPEYLLTKLSDILTTDVGLFFRTVGSPLDVFTVLAMERGRFSDL